jgi:hypothetical protein
VAGETIPPQYRQDFLLEIDRSIMLDFGNGQRGGCLALRDD